MHKLLSAGLYRLRKDKTFWGTLVTVFLISIIVMVFGIRRGNAGSATNLDDYYFYLLPALGLFCAFFTGLFIGTEYTDGTMRNKIVVGHTRAEIYLSNFIVCLIACEGFVGAWLAGGLIGIPAMGVWKSGYAVLLYIVLAVLLTAAMTAVFAVVCMSAARRNAAVWTILLFLFLLFIASYLYNHLCEPEMSSGVMMTANGVQMMEPSPNPDYIGGTRRIVYQFIVDALPTGQSILINNQELGRPLLSAVSSVVIALLTTFGGVVHFRKKDLK